MGLQEKTKLIRDPLYGYIPIRENYCRDFVDTPIFQRLRHIEQTSMRVLYPAAHHDRFAHSLGVFHLASKLFRSLEERKEFGKELRGLDRLRHSFELAALLHDCAHFPFSHTGEVIAVEIHADGIEKTLLDAIDSETFRSDYDFAGASPHELASALIVLKKYKSEAKSYGAEPELIVRMIIGCRYQAPKKQQKIENCLISLINGPAIDVDKLDYLARDSWATGVDNAIVDLDRLIPSICLDQEDRLGCIVISKQACSVVSNVCQARDFLYQWIVCHHKVQLDQHLLKEAIRLLGETLKTAVGAKHRNDVLRPLFHWETLLSPCKIGDLETVYLPADGDIRYLLKKYCGEDEVVKNLLQRKNPKKPVWKTYTEFCLLFKEHLTPEGSSTETKVEAALSEIKECQNISAARKTANTILKKKSWTANVKPFMKRMRELVEEHDWGSCFDVDIKTSIKNLSSLAVRIGDEKMTYGELFGDHQMPVSFYGYLFSNGEKQHATIIETLQKEARIIAGKETK